MEMQPLCTVSLLVNHMYLCNSFTICVFVDPSPSCELYFNDSDAICFGYGSIGYDYVFLNNSVDTKDSLNSKLKMFNNMLHNKVETGGFPTDCIDLILGLMCHHTFPLCDYSSEIPVPRQVCRTYSKPCNPVNFP